MMPQRSNRPVQDVLVVLIVLVAAFCLGRMSAGPDAADGAAWASGQVMQGFPVNAGQQRKEMVEELRAIRSLLEADARSAR